MIIVEDYEAIRRAYHIEKKSIRQIAREQHHSRKTIRKAIGKGHILEFIGESYRFRQRRKMEEQAASTETG